MESNIGIRATLNLPYAQAIQKTTDALKAEGFGVLTQIDVQATLKQKINADFRRYVILGACNPALFEQDGRVIWNAEFVGLLLFLALIGTALANAVWYWLLQREEAGRLTMFLFLVPVLGLGIAALAFGERISLLEGIGSALTVIGVGIVELSNARSRPATQTA